MDLLEEAGIVPPPVHFLTPEDRANLASMALAQRQFIYIAVFMVGIIAGAAVAYALGYVDEVHKIVAWMVSGTGLAVVASIVNTSRLTSFECPRCGAHFFSATGMFSKQCGNCGLPLIPVDYDPASPIEPPR